MAPNKFIEQGVYMKTALSFICIVAFGLGVTGCVTSSPTSDYADVFAVCENPGLDSRYGRFSDKSRGWGGKVAVGLPKGGGALGAYRKRTDVEREYENAERDADVNPVVDAFHQDVVATCKAHMRCMAENRYNERACSLTIAKWRRAQWELTRL